MGQRGPAPRGKREKQVVGNPGKRDLDEKKSLQAPKGMPAKPHLSNKDASEIWDVTVMQLANMGVLSTIDAAMLELYSENFADIRELQKFIRKHGRTYETKTPTGPMTRVRPEVSMLFRARQQHFSIVKEFGLSPSARARLPDPNQGDLFEKNNPFATLN